MISSIRENHIKTNHIFTNGIQLHVAQAGPTSGPLLIFLHGFPEFWYGWRKQIEHFAALGYHVVVPDQRGYNLSDKPLSISAYSVDQLSRDVVGLIDHFHAEKAILVGHDWGGGVAWWTASQYPERVSKLAVLNVPHYVIMNRNLRHNVNQLLKSWYMAFFQLPRLPETFMRAGNFKLLEQTLVNSSWPGTFSAYDLDRYREAWAMPSALSSMVNWYRAALRHAPVNLKSPRIKPKTLLIWGMRDKFLGREMAQPSIDFCDDGRLVFLEKASHWVQHERSTEVNKLLEEFIEVDYPQVRVNIS